MGAVHSPPAAAAPTAGTLRPALCPVPTRIISPSHPPQHGVRLTEAATEAGGPGAWPQSCAGCYWSSDVSTPKACTSQATRGPLEMTRPHTWAPGARGHGPCCFEAVKAPEPVVLSWTRRFHWQQETGLRDLPPRTVTATHVDNDRLLAQGCGKRPPPPPPPPWAGDGAQPPPGWLLQQRVHTGTVVDGNARLFSPGRSLTIACRR